MQIDKDKNTCDTVCCITFNQDDFSPVHERVISITSGLWAGEYWHILMDQIVGLAAVGDEMLLELRRENAPTKLHIRAWIPFMIEWLTVLGIKRSNIVSTTLGS